jgi:hypothetical protein
VGRGGGRSVGADGEGSVGADGERWMEIEYQE